VYVPPGFDHGKLALWVVAVDVRAAVTLKLLLPEIVWMMQLVKNRFPPPQM